MNEQRWRKSGPGRKDEKHRNRKALSWHLKWHIISLGWSWGQAKQYTLDWNNIKLFHLRLSWLRIRASIVGMWLVQLQGLPAWDLILSLNLCFESVLWSPMGKWPMSLELETSAHNLPSHCLPRTASLPLLPAPWCPTHLSGLPWDWEPQPGHIDWERGPYPMSATALCSWVGTRWGCEEGPVLHQGEEQGCGHPNPELAALWWI